MITHLANGVVLLTREDMMQVINVIEKDDGSPGLTIDLPKEETGSLLDDALQHLLIDVANQEVEKNAGKP